MTYFKILIDNKIVSVGNVFLKWNSKRHKLYVCDVDEGQFVQTYDEKNIYKASWLKKAPKDAKTFDTANVVVINETEYNDILTSLQEGEPIIEEVTEPKREEYVVEHEPEPEQEKPMTIAEMRKIILEQQKQIEMLIEKVEKKKR